MSSHKFDLNKSQLKRVCNGGNRFMVNQDLYPALHNMALATIALKKGGVRAPLASECQRDDLLRGGEGSDHHFQSGNNRDTFTLSEGEVVYFPRGYIHHIENIHHGMSRFILCYDHSKPEDLDLSESIGSMSAHVLASTFGCKEEVFKRVKKHAKDTFISQRKTIAKPHPSSIPNHNKFDLERISPQIESKGGSARIANKINFPQLERLALFSLRIAKNGVREPHWHPNATELNYVVDGKARLTIYSPGGDRDTFDLEPGQGSIIPAGYFHHIENHGSSELHMTVYFNNPAPNDIGLSGVLSTFSKEVLASLFSLEPKFFSQMQKFQEDRMIVAGGG